MRKQVEMAPLDSIKEMIPIEPNCGVPLPDPTTGFGPLDALCHFPHYAVTRAGEIESSPVVIPALTIGPSSPQGFIKFGRLPCQLGVREDRSDPPELSRQGILSPSPSVHIK
ncbi:hypothetical protein R1flu_027288 [Riccia fluitans]|uniref:Uncharacterized protein n=1 Tax=Riccia fluitans TaxID=41844 RepID=A0ABD1XIH0_9MARC